MREMVTGIKDGEVSMVGSRVEVSGVSQGGTGKEINTRGKVGIGLPLGMPNGVIRSTGPKMAIGSEVGTAARAELTMAVEATLEDGLQLGGWKVSGTLGDTTR